MSILTYETVEEIDLEYTRPIIVLGPMKVSNSILRRHYLRNFLGCGGGEVAGFELILLAASPIGGLALYCG